MTTTVAGAARSSQAPWKASPPSETPLEVGTDRGSDPDEGHFLPFLDLPPFGDLGDFLRVAGAAVPSWRNLHLEPYSHLPFF